MSEADIAGAIALLEDTGSDTAESTDDASQANDALAAILADDSPLETTEANESVEPVEAAPETPAGPTPAELRAEEMRERLAALKAKNAERAQAQRLKAREAELQARHAEIERASREATDLKSKWQTVTKDPVAAFRELGLDPIQAYEAITSAATKADTPEGREERRLADIEARLEAKYADRFKKYEELEKKYGHIEEHLSARTQYENLAQQKSAENEFMAVANQAGNEDIADFYEPAQLVEIGHALANEMAEAGIRFSITDVFAELKRRHEAQQARISDRRSKRTASSSSKTPVPSEVKAPAGSAQVSKGTTTIGNSIASAPGSSGAKSTTLEQRIAESVKYLNDMDRPARV